MMLTLLFFGEDGSAEMSWKHSYAMRTVSSADTAVQNFLALPGSPRVDTFPCPVSVRAA